MSINLYQWEPEPEGDGQVLRTPFYWNRPLYVIKFRDVQITPRRELAPEERLAGWRECFNTRDEPVCGDVGHQGGLHTRHGTHVLTWQLRPGDEVVLRIDVQFTGYTTYRKGVSRWTNEEEIDSWPTCEEACYDRSCMGARDVNRDYGGKSHYFLARCLSVLGRSVTLGEDGAEDAFGHDRIETAIQDALAFDWDGKYLCQLILEPNDDPDLPYEQRFVKMAPNENLRSRVEG